MKKRWRISFHDPVAIADLARRAEIPPVVAQLLLSRGISDPSEARWFLKPSLQALHPPEAFPACEQAADIIWAAIQARQRIAIYGDYDADGITATAILWKCLKLLGADVRYYVPNRLEEGYGLQTAAIEDLVQQGVQLIVTVDCGITAIPEVAFAREKGIEIIVTDHHEPGPDLPQAAAIVHPRIGSSPFPFPWLSGAGVAFRLAWAIARRASSGQRTDERLRDFLVQAVGLAAIG
ncbi:MAG TPA: DHH family phosphoesterase, partial [Thermogutta sp.]|nr:DHH family phosphoesterase [Thermogutta sp.]